MKRLFTICCMLVSATLMAQQKEEQMLRMQMKRFDQGLLRKDTLMLRETTHPDVSYGHSNGWIENRRELTADLFNGKIEYRLIEPKEAAITIAGETGIVRYDVEINAALEGLVGT